MASPINHQVSFYLICETVLIKKALKQRFLKKARFQKDSIHQLLSQLPEEKEEHINLQKPYLKKKLNI